MLFTTHLNLAQRTSLLWNDIWVDGSGVACKIAKMSDRHIESALRYLERQPQAFMGSAYPDFRGEMAQYYAEMAWVTAEQHYGDGVTFQNDAIKAFKAEQVRRRQLPSASLREKGMR